LYLCFNCHHIIALRHTKAADIAVGYANQTECDYQALVGAVKSGRLEVSEEKV